ncbi:gluzincin family metallopeptidase [Roseivirga misakiensis]|nr:hypothetical protein [Roseivirga misakiensis]
MRLKLLSILFIITIIGNISAQEKHPVLTGEVEISISEGTFECDLTLSDIPRIKDYFIRLNSGMNILHMRSKKPHDFLVYYDRSLNDTLSSGESNAYYFGDNTGKNKFLPESIQFKYTGKFPVVRDTIEDYSRKDWKGNIAFNKNSVRSDGFQSAWYPVLYDITNDQVLDEVFYDIKLTCSDCKSLYVNGNKPIYAKSYNFKSQSPKELTIFCGNYEFSEFNNTYFLNSGLSGQQLKEFGELINSYKAYYADHLKIPFDQPVSFVQTTPTSKKDGWMFVSYPTIMSIDWQNGLKSIVEPEYEKIYRPYIAHELGHFYFGTHKVFNSALGDMMSEGFSEYLSLQLTKDRIGKDVYEKMIDRKIKNLGSFNPTPFGKINSESEYINRQLYSYNYAPLIFSSIEKEIGEQKMWEWLNLLLSTSTKFTNYNFLVSTLGGVLKNETKLNDLISKYFENKNSLENAINKLKEID